jgi:hypothetical protein
VTPSLTRGRVCNLLLLLVLASAVPRDSIPYFIVPILETPSTWRARSPYLYSPGTGWPSYTPGHRVPFSLLLTTRRATAEVLYPASTRVREGCISCQRFRTTSVFLRWPQRKRQFLVGRCICKHLTHLFPTKHPPYSLFVIDGQRNFLSCCLTFVLMI